MAKKKQSGPSTGLIIVLIFFVLGTFGAGTVAYFGYADQEQFKADKKKAEEAKDTALAQFREERVRKVMLRIATGVEDPADRVLLVQELKELRPQIKDEYDRILRGLNKEQKITVPLIYLKTDKNLVAKMGTNEVALTEKDTDIKVATKDVEVALPVLKWKLLEMGPDAVRQTTDGLSAEDLANLPAVRPEMTLHSMLASYIALTRKAVEEAEIAQEIAKDAKKNTSRSVVSYTKIEEDLNKERAKIIEETKAKFDKINKDFEDFKAKHAKDHSDATATAKKFGDADNQKADEIAKLNDKIKDLGAKLEKYDAQNTGGRFGSTGVDFVNLEERKGEIVRKEQGGFVTINIGSSKKLKTQITFLVVSANVSWLALQEKEESLKRLSPRGDRQPFEDNPYVKAGIEVVEITGPESARAKIIFENEPIRNPIQPHDQIFNLAWQPDEEMRIAFAGIIDLDGDGLDNNEDFLRMLERQGVVVDEYLRLKPLEFVKRDNKGMSLKTKYLVIADSPRLDSLTLDKDTPQTLQIKATMDKMSDIRGRARELGVQVIEARKFLAMIGYKLPKNPAPPAYGAATYLDTSAAPMPEPKKEKEKN